MASSSGWACTAMRVSGSADMAGSVWGAGAPSSRLEVPDLARQYVEFRPPILWRPERAHDELGEADLEEPLDQGAQAGHPDGDDVLERPAPGPARQRRRRQRRHVEAVGGIGQAHAEVLRADGASVL